MVDAAASLIQVLTPLLLALGGGIWAVYKHFHPTPKPEEEGEDGEKQQDGPAVLQGVVVPTPAFREEWTWQDELRETKADLRDANAREDAYREALIRAGVEPRDVLERAGIIPVTPSYGQHRQQGPVGSRA